MRLQPKFRPEREPGLDILIDRAPSLGDIARVCGISRPSVSNWHRVPVRHVLLLERIYGVPKEEMRPDIYPPPR